MDKPTFDSNSPDRDLVAAAVAGSQEALTALIKKHQDWIYNLAVNFTGNTAWAADLTQEVLIKLLTKLSSFRLESEFRTWMYRLVKNHFLNMKRGKYAPDQLSFEQFGAGLDQLPDEQVPRLGNEVEEKLLVQEAKISCMKAMLLCLDREQRMIFILGELFEFSDTVGGEIMEISRSNFRVKLHRARQQLYNFMNDKCGLINKQNACRCARKTAGFVRLGYVDPVRKVFQQNRIADIARVVQGKVNDFAGPVTRQYQQLYQAHPFQSSPDQLAFVKQLMTSTTMRRTFDLDN